MLTLPGTLRQLRQLSELVIDTEVICMEVCENVECKSYGGSVASTQTLKISLRGRAMGSEDRICMWTPERVRQEL